MEMDQIVNFLQERLAQDFENDDDAVIEQLKVINFKIICSAITLEMYFCELK